MRGGRRQARPLAQPELSVLTTARPRQAIVTYLFAAGEVSGLGWARVSSPLRVGAGK